MASLSGTIEDKLKKAFTEEQAGILGEVLSDLKPATERDLVRRSDFNELKEIVKELAAVLHLFLIAFANFRAKYNLMQAIRRQPKRDGSTGLPEQASGKGTRPRH